MYEKEKVIAKQSGALLKYISKEKQSEANTCISQNNNIVSENICITENRESSTDAEAPFNGYNKECENTDPGTQPTKCGDTLRCMSIPNWSQTVNYEVTNRYWLQYSLT